MQWLGGEFHPLAFDVEQVNRMISPIPRNRPYTHKQGQYLAFIHYYTKINRYPPSEVDMRRYFKVTPPSVHQMVLTLERRGFIDRVPRQPRTIRVLVAEEDLPVLE